MLHFNKWDKEIKEETCFNKIFVEILFWMTQQKYYYWKESKKTKEKEGFMAESLFLGNNSNTIYFTIMLLP